MIKTLEEGVYVIVGPAEEAFTKHDFAVAASGGKLLCVREFALAHEPPDRRFTLLLREASSSDFLLLEHPENGFHPSVIRKLVEELRATSEERHSVVLMDTDSPVILNEFKEHVDLVLVAEPGRGVLRLDELVDPHYLAHFALGDLYDRGEFGAPVRTVRRVQ